MEQLQSIKIRPLVEGDIPSLVDGFTSPWSTPEKTLQLWLNNWKEQQDGIRAVFIIEKGQILGYGSLLKKAENPEFLASGIPEINALWIQDKWRGKGLGTKLIQHIESIARKENYKTIGIGVGLYQDYGPAQKLYFKLGYSPDGKGVTYKGVKVVPGESYPVDDELILWLIKPLKKSFRFKLVEKSDRNLVHAWLKTPHAAEWFYGDGLQGTIRHLDEFLNGSSSAQYWLGLDDETPFAFLITSNVDKPVDELTKWCNKEGSAITLDVLIGDMNYLGKGYSVQLIREFILCQFPRADEVLIDPEVINAKAIHVYQKAGFEILAEFIPTHSPKPHLMMKLDCKKLKKHD